jgi:hypothetical protein
VCVGALTSLRALRIRPKTIAHDRIQHAIAYRPRKWSL